MVSTTNTITNITNHQLLTIKNIKKWFPVVCFGTYSIRIGLNKPPIEGDPQGPLQFPLNQYKSHYNQQNHYKFCDGVCCFFQQGVVLH